MKKKWIALVAIVFAILWVCVGCNSTVKEKDTVIPAKGVTKKNVKESLEGEMLNTEEGEWNIESGEIKSIEIQDRKTDLKKKTDNLTVKLTLDSDAETASGKVKMEYVFDDGWKLKSIKEQGKLKSSVKEDKKVNVIEDTQEDGQEDTQGGETSVSEEFDSMYKTRYEETNMVTCPVFEFSYPSSRWKVTDEQMNNGGIEEKVTISNDRGIEVTYWSCGRELGAGARLVQVAEITKADDSSFIPTCPAGTDKAYSYLGNFMVAKVHIIKENDGSSEEYKNVDGETFYAVIPESKTGETEFQAQTGHVDAFSWQYPSNYAFIATSPDGKFNQNEEKDVINILKSFKVVDGTEE